MKSDDGGYIPRHLRLWTRPEFYSGKNWYDYYAVVGRSRDSDVLARSNFRSVERDLATAVAEAIAEGFVEELRGRDQDGWVINAWASDQDFGWREFIGVRKDAPFIVLGKAEDISYRLKWEAMYNENDYTTLESEEQREFVYNGLGEFLSYQGADEDVDGSKTPDEWVDLIYQLIRENEFEFTEGWVDLEKLAKLSPYYKEEE